MANRHIVDNIIIAQELIHTIHHFKRQMTFIAIKKDLEKAYDHLGRALFMIHSF